MGLFTETGRLLQWLAGSTALLLAGGLVMACSTGGGGTLQSQSSNINQHSQASEPKGPLRRRTNVKVALLLPLSKSGQGGKIAKGLKEAGELALFEFDKPDVIVFSKDTKGTPEGARAAAEEAIANGAELIIGPLYSSSVAAAAAVTRQAGVPMIAFSSDRNVAGSGVYLLSFLAGADVPRIIGYSASQGLRTFAALIPGTPYGDILERSFRQSVQQLGGRVVTVQRYPLDANGMLAPARKIKDIAKQAEARGDPLDGLLIAAGQETLPTLAPILPYVEIDTKKIKLLGTGDWDFANVGKEAVLLGGWYAAPDPQGWREFTRRYVKTYGRVPPRISSLAYDAVSLAVSLSKGPAGQRYSAANLTRPSGFAGVDGLFRLQPGGTVERGLAILEVQKFGARVADPAPSIFSSSRFSSTQTSSNTY